MGFDNPQYLVSTAWLAGHLDGPKVRVLDVTAMLTRDLVNRARDEFYAKGHIAGSLFLDIASGHGDLSDPAAPLPWTWPSAEQVADTMGRLGVAQDTRVVLVARTPRPGIDSGTMWCTRAWWILHHAGVDVAVLHGGIEQWLAEGRPLVTGEPHVEPGGFEVLDGWERGRADRHDVLAALEDTSVCVLDALPSSNFDGSAGGYGARKGHITGAENLPFRDLLEGETAKFLAPAQLRARLDAAGLLTRPKVIAYCGGAIAATVDAFALALCGQERVAVYDGSLMEWSADPELPMTDPSAG